MKVINFLVFTRLGRFLLLCLAVVGMGAHFWIKVHNLP